MMKLILVLVVVVAGVLIYSIAFTDAARACRGKGGSYFLNGDCVKMKMEIIP